MVSGRVAGYMAKHMARVAIFWLQIKHLRRQNTKPQNTPIYTPAYPTLRALDV